MCIRNKLKQHELEKRIEKKNIKLSSSCVYLSNADAEIIDPIPNPHVSHIAREEKRIENNQIGEFLEQVRKWEEESMLRSFSLTTLK